MQVLIVRLPSGYDMTKDSFALPDPPLPKPTKQQAERQAKADRVAAALRENLLKRKQQARDRIQQKTTPP